MLFALISNIICKLILFCSNFQHLSCPFTRIVIFCSYTSNGCMKLGVYFTVIIKGSHFWKIYFVAVALSISENVIYMLDANGELNGVHRIMLRIYSVSFVLI